MPCTSWITSIDGETSPKIVVTCTARYPGRSTRRNLREIEFHAADLDNSSRRAALIRSHRACEICTSTSNPILITLAVTRRVEPGVPETNDCSGTRNPCAINEAMEALIIVCARRARRTSTLHDLVLPSMNVAPELFHVSIVSSERLLSPRIARRSAPPCTMVNETESDMN